MDATQKLTIQAELQGGAQTADGLQKIAAAQEQVNRSAAQATAGPATIQSPLGPRGFAPATGGAAPLDDAKLKFKDLNNLLSILDPRLGALIGRLARATEAFGDLGTKAIDFAAVGKGLVETLTRMGPALGLLAAGGAVVAGIAAITAAMARMREETAKATEELERQQQKANDLRQAQSAGQASIEGISDARRRGGFDADTSRKAQSVFETIKGRFPQLEDSAVRTAIGNLFDVTQDPTELAEAAFLLQTDRLKFSGRETAGRAQTRFDRARNRNQGQFESFRNRENEQVRELVEAARLELRSEGGSTSALREFIGKFVDPTLPDEDEQALITFLEKVRSRRGLEREYTETTTSNLEGTRTRKRPIEDPTGIRALRFFNELEQRDTPVKRPGTPVSTTIHQYNGRYIGSDAAAQRGRMRNGETRARERELV